MKEEVRLSNKMIGLGLAIAGAWSGGWLANNWVRVEIVKDDSVHRNCNCNTYQPEFMPIKQDDTKKTTNACTCFSAPSSRLCLTRGR